MSYETKVFPVPELTEDEERDLAESMGFDWAKVQQERKEFEKASPEVKDAVKDVQRRVQREMLGR